MVERLAYTQKSVKVQQCEIKQFVVTAIVLLGFNPLQPALLWLEIQQPGAIASVLLQFTIHNTTCTDRLYYKPVQNTLFGLSWPQIRPETNKPGHKAASDI